MNYLFHFAAALGLSIIGTLPLGIINLTVVSTALRAGSRSAIAVAAGATFIELFQASFALTAAQWIMSITNLEYVLDQLALIIFILLAAYHFRKYVQEYKSPRLVKHNSSGTWFSSFSRGMGVSLLNVLVFPYWMFYGGYLGSHGWLQDYADTISFVLGILIGTFACLILFVLAARLVSARMNKWAKRADLMIGLVFSGFAIVQLLRILF